MKNKQGFTLIELLIVVAIIAILAAIAIPNFLQAQVRAKVSRSEAELQSLATALEAYCVDNGVYTNQIQPGTTTPILPVVERLVPLTTPIAYITSVPLDVFETNVPDNLEGPALFDGYNTYIYAYAPQSVAAGDSPPVGSAGYVAIWGENYQWLLEGFGPMLSDPVTWYDGIASASGPLYDPTNGTISPGHIIREGP